MEGQEIQWVNQVEAEPSEVFDGLRSLASGVRKNANGPGLIDLMSTAPDGRQRVKPFGIERWRLAERQVGLSAIREVLADWPDGFVQRALAKGLYRSRFGLRQHPGWVERELRRLERPMANLYARWAAKKARTD